MALQRTTEDRSGTHSYTREGAEPFAIGMMRAIFLSYPPREQERIRMAVIRRLRDEQRSHEFRAAPSALSRYAGPVYGITQGDIR